MPTTPFARDARWAASTAFLSSRGRVDIACLIDSKTCDLTLWCAIQNESIALRRNPVNQTAAVRTGDYVALRIEGQHSNVRLVALEEERVLPVRRNPKNLSMISSGYVEVAVVIEQHAPDVFRAGIKIDG